MTRWNTFTWMRAVRDSELPSGVRHTLLTLSTYANGGQCWPSRQELAAATGYHPSTVSEHLGLADEAGWVGRRRRIGKPTLYTLQLPTSPEGDGSGSTSTDIPSIGQDDHRARRPSDVGQDDTEGRDKRPRRSDKPTFHIEQPKEQPKEQPNKQQQQPEEVDLASRGSADSPAAAADSSPGKLSGTTPRLPSPPDPGPLSPLPEEDGRRMAPAEWREAWEKRVGWSWPEARELEAHVLTYWDRQQLASALARETLPQAHSPLEYLRATLEGIAKDSGGRRKTPQKRGHRGESGPGVESRRPTSQDREYKGLVPHTPDDYWGYDVLDEIEHRAAEDLAAEDLT